MPSILLATIVYDLAGREVFRTLATSMPEKAFTAEQLHHLALGLEVCIVSTRGRVDYTLANRTVVSVRFSEVGNAR